MRSHLLTQSTTGLPLFRSRAATSLSLAVTPAVRSVTSTITSAESMAIWAWLRIFFSSMSSVLGSMPPVSTSMNSRFSHSPWA